MKAIKLISILFMLTFNAFGQIEKAVDSKITTVTVFLNKAQVKREVKTRIEAGKTTLILTGLTSQLDQQSIQVSGEGNFIILGISHKQNYLDEMNMPKPLKILKDSATYIQKQIILEQSQKEILSKEEQMLLSNQKIGGANQNLTAIELKAMADFFRTRLTEIVSSQMKADEKIKKLNERINKLQQQIDEQNAHYTNNTSEVLISLSADAATAVDMVVIYIVPNAGWNPSYDLRAINTKSPVQLNYKANVYQNTGEEWKSVKLTLSTANPSLGGLKPELSGWYLDFYQPIYRYNKEKKLASGAEMRQQSPPVQSDMSTEEEGKSMPAETVANFVNTIQTSLNTEFNIELPYTVSSSNKPTLVDIRNYEMKADYLYSVAPKLDQDAFLLARATGWEEFNLLPGEANVFFEGTFVGTSFIDPNNIKDTLNISLGRDKRIVVKREKLKDFSSRKFIGSNQRESYAYEISIRNTKPDAIKIIVEDQVPVSQNSQIDVTTTDLGAAKYNKESGKLTWEFNIQPSETKKVVYKFEVKYPKDRQVQGL